MFSGIVQCMATVAKIDVIGGGGLRMKMHAPLPVDRFQLGASVAHSGACMTVVEARALGDRDAEYIIDISPESLAKTTMGHWQVGTKVNLETSLKIGDENGGHNVMGHVDGLAELIHIVPRGESFDLRFRVDSQYMGYLPHKGSVALDGMSLTIVDPDLATSSFGVAVIPHTWEVTTLHTRHVGDMLNFEIDTFARYIANYVDHYMALKG